MLYFLIIPIPRSISINRTQITLFLESINNSLNIFFIGWSYEVKTTNTYKLLIAFINRVTMNKKDAYGATCLFLLSIILTSTFIHGYSPMPEDGYFVVLELNHYDSDNNLIERKVIDNDIILRQFAYLLFKSYCGIDTDESFPYDNKDMDGVNRNYEMVEDDNLIDSSNAKIHI
jgi:hypothetical protein